LREPFDGVVVANRTNLHVPTAIKAAEQGLNLFLEKLCPTRWRRGKASVHRGGQGSCG
jgi:hypothetical protein